MSNILKLLILTMVHTSGAIYEYLVITATSDSCEISVVQRDELIFITGNGKTNIVIDDTSHNTKYVYSVYFENTNSKVIIRIHNSRAFSIHFDASVKRYSSDVYDTSSWWQSPVCISMLALATVVITGIVLNRK